MTNSARSPKALLNILKSCTKNSKSIEYQVFRGICNDDGINHNHNYCYAISFLQIFFHCPDVINYFRTQHPKNQSERLLKNIFKEIYKKNNYSSIKIIDFILNWRGWDGNILPNIQMDIVEFVQYLLQSVSNHLSDLFFIDGKFNDDNILLYSRNYFLTLIPFGSNISECLDNIMKKCKQIDHFPKYLLLSLVRNDGLNLNKKYQAINTFLQIENNVYKHLGTVVFTGSQSSGHYVSYIKIDGEYFQFNDEIVSALFYYNKCPNNLRDFISNCNNQMNTQGTLFLYEKTYTTFIKNTFENITFNPPQIILPGTAPNIAMNNTLTSLNIINSSRNANQISTLSSNQNSIQNPITPSQNNSKKSSLSQPRVEKHSLQLNNHQSFQLSSLSDSEELSFKGIGHYDHSDLKRTNISLKDMHITNLCGKLNISMSGIPKILKERKLKSKFANWRQLFKYTGKILRNLKYNDQGKVNSEILQTHLNIQNNDLAEIVNKGNLLYDIMNELLEQRSFEMKDVELKLSPIIEWYFLNYGGKNITDSNHDTLINNDLANNLFDPIVPMKKPSCKEELDEYISNIIENEEEDEEFNPDVRNCEQTLVQMLDFSIDPEEINECNMNKIITNIEDEFDDIFYYYYEGERPKNSKHKLFDDPKLDDVIDFNSNDALFDNEPFRNAIRKDIANYDEYDFQLEYDESTQSLYPQNQSNYYLSGALEWLGKEKDYKQIYDDANDDTYFDDDDNQFSIAFYNWKERAEITDVKIIYNEIINYNLTKNKKKNLKPTVRRKTVSDLVLEVEQDILRSFNRNPQYINDIDSFINMYNDNNSVSDNMTPCVKQLKKVRGISDDQPIYTKKTFMKKLNKFKKLTSGAQTSFLNANLSNWGGSRDILRKVTDQTLLCLITLILDFPTLSTSSYVTYLNSKYGPNYKKNITLRTVERYLNILGFSVKRASFAPPNRNSVGLRIFRVAWCKMIEDILKQDNILIGFIDEAAITTCEGKSYGKAFSGITPLSNCPLSKVKMSVIAIVFPGFGVLYKIISNSTTGDKYAEFINEAIEFTRKYICNKDVEIVIIEDNCPIHNTEIVEEIIDHLGIALIPIVQYSPALNEVIEGYFGLVKTHIFIDSTKEGENLLKDSIEKQWEQSTMEFFDDKKSEKLYIEWRTRMQQCKNGEPLHSGHVSSNNQFNSEIQKLTNVLVDRLITQVE